jgi:hypothetical protein
MEPQTGQFSFITSSGGRLMTGNLVASSEYASNVFLQLLHFGIEIKFRFHKDKAAIAAESPAD